nr:hypothetical protein [Dyadobacter sp. SG02]
MNQDVKLSQVIPVYNAKSDKVASAAYVQLFADPALVVFNAFRLNNEACRYFGGGKAIGHERQHVPFAIGQSK